MAANFVLLRQDEARVKLKKLAQQAQQIRVWQKGNQDRFWLRCVGFEDPVLKVTDAELSFVSSRDSHDILFNFEVDGLPIFGLAQVFKTPFGYTLENFREVYKCERRKDFRLLTYPAYNVYFSIGLKEFQFQLKTPKVVALHRSGVKDQLELFKAFQQLIAQKGKGSRQVKLDDHTQFRILDLSLTGVSFKISEFELPYFEDFGMVQEFKIHFEGQHFLIPAGRVVYVEAFDDYSGSRQKYYKVGVKFINLPDELRTDLVIRLNKELSKFAEEEFEELLK